MQKILFTLLLASLSCLGGLAQEVSANTAEAPVAQEPTAQQAAALSEARKEALIRQAGVPEHVLPAMREAAKAMSYEALKSYLEQPHHAYDGHSVLDHARMKVRFAPPLQGKTCPDCGNEVTHAEGHAATPAWISHYTGKDEQYSRFPIPLSAYAQEEKSMTLMQKLAHRVDVDPFNLAASLVFLLAILHTFMAPFFQSLAHKMEKRHKENLLKSKFQILHPEQRVPVSFAATLCHFLGEVEVVFGLWIIPFYFVCQHNYSLEDFLRYIDKDTSFT